MNKKKYPLGGNPLVGGLLGALTTKASSFPETMRVGKTRPNEMLAMASAEQGKQDAMDYIKSKRYKDLLKKELKKSKATDYPTGIKPTFDQLYNERLTRVESTPMQHIEKSPYIWDYKQQTNLGGQNLNYPGANDKIFSSTFVNPLFDPTKMSEVGTPSKGLVKEFRDAGLEESIHGTHNPLKSKSTTSINLPKPGSKTTNRYKNITPFALDVIRKNTVAPEQITDFAEDYTPKEIKAKQDYTSVPTEIMAQIPKILNEREVKGKFRNKDFKEMVNNPTIGSERLLNATSGSMDPFVKLKEDKKLYRQTKKRTKEILNNVAMEDENLIPIARNGGQMKKKRNGGKAYYKNQYSQVQDIIGLPTFNMGGDTEQKGGFNMKAFGNIAGNVGGAVSGSLNSGMEWKQNESYDVSNNGLQKGAEAGFGSNPVSGAFMGIGKAGEGVFDSMVPGLGESIFSPHKKYIRAHKEKNPRYLIPVAGSIIAAMDSQKELDKEKSLASRSLNPYGDSYLRNGGELIKYDAPTHENGGEMITKEGQPTNDPNQGIAEIEKKETYHDGYVFSDTLKHKSGKTFAAVSKAIDKAFKGKNTTLDSRTRKKQLEMLKQQNEASRIEVESNQPKQQFNNGGTIDPTKLVGEEIIAAKQDNDYTYNPFQQNSPLAYSTTPISTITPTTVGTQNGKAQALSRQLRNLGSTAKANVAGQGIPGMTFKGQKAYPFKDKYSTKEIEPIQGSIEQTFDMGKAEKLAEEDTKFPTKEKKGSDYLTAARIGKGIEMAGKAGIMSAGFDKVNPELNPQAKRVAELMRNRNINSQAQLNQINLQRNAALANNQSARSLNVKRALDQRTYSAAAQQSANAKLQEQMQNAGYRGQEAQVLSRLGSEEAQAKVYAADATARNKGQWLTNLGTVLGDVGRAGAFESKVKMNDMQVAESLAMLGTKYENYGIDGTTIERLKKGKYTLKDIDKLQDALIKYNGK